VNQKKIAFVITATGNYFVLGLRLANKINKHYAGDHTIDIHFFSDQDPTPYLKHKNIVYVNMSHDKFEKITMKKTTNPTTINYKEYDYVFLSDADTNINKDFNDSDFIGELVAVRHFADKFGMSEVKTYERNPMSAAYIPYDTDLEQIYYCACFLGGLSETLISFINEIIKMEKNDLEKGIVPIWHDESYVNKFFHHNPPSFLMEPFDTFLVISDKGNLKELESGALEVPFKNIDLEKIKNDIQKLKDKDWDIVEHQVVEL
jgi:histo-blood group ABO system transferase